MIVTCDGIVNKKSESSAQMTCIVSTTGLAFSNKKVSVAKAVVRYVRKKMFFTKLAFMKAFDDIKLKFGKESNQQSGEIVINGPPKGSV
jgi:hypothetical protein